MQSPNLDRLLAMLGHLAVLGGLIFLALEIQQNTNAVRASAVQEATNVARNQILLFVQDPDINRIAMARYSELNEEDQSRKFWLTRSFWLGMQGLYRQTKLGAFPEEEWETWDRIICSNYAEIETPLWEANAATLAKDFVDQVESCSGSVRGVYPE